MIKESQSQTRELSSSDALSKTTSTRSWKKLEEKYLCYVNLLKTRVSQSKHKLQQQRTAFGLKSLSASLKGAIHRHEMFALDRILRLVREDEISLRQKHFPLGDLALSKRTAIKASPQLVEDDFARTVQAIKLSKFAQFIKNKEKLARMNAFQRIRTSRLFSPLNDVKQALSQLKTSLNFDYLSLVPSKDLTPKFESFVQSLIRENCRLNLRCVDAEERLTQLRRQLEINNEARESDIRKKTESLQRIALELHEKDEMLREMEKDLEQYDERERCNKGRLLTPSTEAQYKLETMKLEQENYKLVETMHEKEIEYREQLKRLKDDLARLQFADKRLATKEQQFECLLERNFNLQYECNCLVKENNDLKGEVQSMRCRPQHAESSFNDMNNLVTFLTRTNSITKDTSVTSTEKIEAIQALMADRGLWTTISNSAEISKLSVLTAIEQLLEQEEHSVVYETTLHKFDESTKAKIEEIGNKIKQLKIGTSKDLFRTRSSPSGKQDQPLRICTSEPNLFDSVLEAFPEQSIVKKRQPEQLPSAVAPSMEPHHGKNKAKLEEMVLTLKDRQMAVRNIIFQLLRSLELKKLPKEADNILGVLFDLFEYSEEEKIQIFRKRESKGFLGIF